MWMVFNFWKRTVCCISKKEIFSWNNDYATFFQFMIHLSGSNRKLWQQKPKKNCTFTFVNCIIRAWKIFVDKSLCLNGFFFIKRANKFSGIFNKSSAFYQIRSKTLACTGCSQGSNSIYISDSFCNFFWVTSAACGSVNNNFIFVLSQ